ncbi:MAG: TIR domain-containing protein [Verrucomicrobia bacterium]|nr:TIR domain-containing protein [Verrucomicrobiota bacterium]
MSASSPSSATPGAVFLSYASQDADAARRICETLRAAGIEVWFDQNELVGGDAWDAKIRRQISTCALFAPIISASTQARLEGYFRIEWKLAAQRTHAMADEKAFILPIVIDDTRDADAKVPAEFKSVQWTRLPAGDTPPKFCERVKSLLDGEVAPASRRPPDIAGQMPARPPKVGRRVPAAAWITAVVALAATAAFLALRPTPPNAGAGTRPASAEKPAAPLSEARRLAAQAQEILLKTELGLTELDAAALLCERAAALDSADAVVWATASEVETWRAYFGSDRSPERVDGARTKAARALSLSPSAFESRRAQACYQVGVIGGRVAAEAEPVLRGLVEERPQDRQSVLMLGLALRQQSKADEAAQIFERLATLPGQTARACNELGWLYYSARRYDDANAAIDRSIAAEPFSGNVSLKVALAQHWLGDLDAAQTALEKLPRARWLEDRVLGAAIRVFHWKKEPAKLLALLENVPRDWITWGIEGPKAAITGDAHAQLNHTAAARNDWTTALAVVEKRLGATPNDWKLNVWKAYLLAALGQMEASTQALTLARESSNPAYNQISWWLLGRPNIVLAYNLLPRLVGPEELLTELEKRVASVDTCPPLNNLRLNPTLAAVRELPGFAAVLAKAASHPNTAPAAKLPAATPAPPEKSLAVIALDNLGGDPANEAISDGISEELLNSLGRVPGLRVVGGRSTFAFKGTKTSEKEIGRQLGVTHLVIGSIRRSGDNVRVMVRLVQAETGVLIWNDAFNPELKDMLATQERIAGVIAQKLSLALGAPTATAKSIKQEAYVLYLQGMELWHNRLGPDYLDKLRQIEATMRRALAIEPEFVPAHARLAEALAYLNGGLAPLDAEGRPTPALVDALRSANRAIELDPNSAEAQSVRAEVLRLMWRHPEAEAAYRRAIAINPNLALTRARFSRLLEADGRMDEALAELERATLLDPLASRALDNLSLMLMHAGRLTAALAAAERSLALAPANYQALFNQANTLHQLGRSPEAQAIARKLAQLEADPASKSDFAGYTCELQVREGRRTEAEKFFERIPRTLIADRVYAAAVLGRKNEALAELTAQWLPAFWIDEVLWNPIFDPLRPEPEFIAWLKKTGLTEAHTRAQAWRAAHPPEKAPAK